MNTMEDLKQEAEDLIRRVDKGDYAGARRLFNSEMAQAFSEPRLKETWLELMAQVGPLQQIIACQAVERQDRRVVTVTCQFERAAIDFYVVFDQSGQIASLVSQPTPVTSAYNPPAYVHTQAFHDVEVTVGSGEWALPGTLSWPEGAGPFPAVVLVHGSGPQDRDETIGPSKPFRDLAWGLASQGIAVLRYEKRTREHSGKLTRDMLARLTVQEEVVDDALHALQLLHRMPGIDPSSVYMLGHSLGATMAPRIGQQEPSIAGLVVLAGLTRRLEDTILDQFTYVYSLSGAMTDGQRAELERLKEKVIRVKDSSLSDQVPAKDLPMEIPPAYWLALRGYHPEEVAASLAMRIFVLQGGRDYQVTAEGDLPAWQQALGENSNATLKLYPRLSHMFAEGEGPSTPQESLVEGHVSEEVIQDIALWIRGQDVSNTL